MPKYEFTYFEDEFAQYGCKTASKISQIQQQIEADFKNGRFTVSRVDVPMENFTRAQIIVERNPRR